MRVNVSISNYNTSHRLRSTLESIKNQTHDDINLIVVDSCSDDGFEAIIDEYSSIINHVIVEEDNGLYDGLSKAFSIDRGNGIYCYINAGDVYMPYAFEAVCRAFEYSACDWMTGVASHRNSHLFLFDVCKPWPFSLILLKLGFYDGKLLPCIQQESTFWSYRLHRQINLSAFRSFCWAGDFYLWHVFSQLSSLRILNAVVSSFTHHGDHLSDSRKKYDTEISRILGFRTILKFIFWPIAFPLGLLMKASRIPSYIYKKLPGIINI